MVFVAGIVCGLFNGLLIAVFGISPMIATMGSQYIIRGLCYILTQAKTILFTNPALEFIGRGNILGIPNSIIIMLLVFLILSYVLNKTRFGRSVYAVGSNEKASYLSGISPVKVKLGAYVIAAVSSTLGGIITVSQVGAAVPSSGVGSEMEIIAAVYLGGVAAMGGKGNLIGTFLGVLVICCIKQRLDADRRAILLADVYARRSHTCCNIYGYIAYAKNQGCVKRIAELQEGSA